MKSSIKTPRRRWARLGARVGMVAGALITIAMLWLYGAVERGVFEVDVEGMDELRSEVERDEMTWFDDQVAWIRIFGTHIDYPVMQANDNKWFLNHDHLNREATNGSIFLDCRNDRNFLDDISVIYGHRMNGDLMFSDIAKYDNSEFFREHESGELILRNGERLSLRVVEFRKVYADDELYRDFELLGYEDGAIVLSACVKGNHEMRDILILEQ